MNDKNLSSIQQLNIDIARALGVTDPGRLSGLQLVLAPGQLPEVTMRFHLNTADGLHEVLQRCQIVCLPN